MPADLKDAEIVSIFKKGDRSVCGNYRGISLLSIVGKVIARLLLNRLLPLAEEILPESQCGFRPQWGTIGMVFTLRQLQEKCREQQRPLYLAFVDLTKAFDSVDRSTLRRLLVQVGCPEKFVSMVKLLHEGMRARVRCDNGTTTDAFPINTGVKQGCVLAPTLFSIFVTVVLWIVQRELPLGIQLNYRLDGSIFNLRRLKAKSKVSELTVTELQYADDTVICASSEEDLQRMVDAFADEHATMGLTLNCKKIQTIYQPSPSMSCPSPPHVAINGESLTNVEKLPYLRSLISERGTLDAEYPTSTKPGKFFLW